MRIERRIERLEALLPKQRGLSRNEDVLQAALARASTEDLILLEAGAIALSQGGQFTSEQLSAVERVAPLFEEQCTRTGFKSFAEFECRRPIQHSPRSRSK